MAQEVAVGAQQKANKFQWLVRRMQTIRPSASLLRSTARRSLLSQENVNGNGPAINVPPQINNEVNDHPQISIWAVMERKPNLTSPKQSISSGLFRRPFGPPNLLGELLAHNPAGTEIRVYQGPSFLSLLFIHQDRVLAEAKWKVETVFLSEPHLSDAQFSWLA